MNLNLSLNLILFGSSKGKRPYPSGRGLLLVRFRYWQLIVIDYWALYPRRTPPQCRLLKMMGVEMSFMISPVSLM